MKPIFKKLLDILILNLSTKNVVNITIEGHTDSKGSQQRNIILSTQRAEAIRYYFLKSLPDLHEIIFAYGRASAFPVADNATEKGRAQNRRVKIILAYKNKSEYYFF